MPPLGGCRAASWPAPLAGGPPPGASPRQALRAPGPVAAAPAVPPLRCPQLAGSGARASQPGCQHSAATAILRHSKASRAPIFKRSRAQLWLDNAGFALISQSGGAHRGGTSAPRQGFGLRAVPLLCHSHLLTLATSWVQGTGSLQAPSSSTRTSQPWGNTGTVQGRAGTRGIGGSGETSGSQRQHRDATKEGGHLETPRASPGTRKEMTPWEGTKGKPERPKWSPVHLEETGHPRTAGDLELEGVLRGGPGGDGALGGVPGGERGPEETGYAGGAQHPGGIGQPPPSPGWGLPPRAGGHLGGGCASRGSHRFGFLLGGEVVVESLGVLPGPPRRARCPGGARRLHGAAAPCAPGAAGGALYRAARGAPGSNPPG